jgi:hypothetical protein
MSKMMYVKEPAPKSVEMVVTKPSTTHYNTLMITIVAYKLCEDDILLHERMGAYHSVDETMAAMKSCDGVAS